MINKYIGCLLSVVLLLSLTSCSKDIEMGHLSDNSFNLSESPPQYDIQRECIRVAYNDIGKCYNPFFAESSVESDIVDLTHLQLLTFDNNGDIINNGIEGETKLINGKEVEFKGISDFSIVKTDIETYLCEIELKSDINFSDGTGLSIDDIIFSIYVLCDNSYNGPSLFNTLPIIGLDDYKNGKSDCISGINRINDYSLTIELQYYNPTFLNYLNIYIAPLHYYGNKESYDYANHSFGFEKGNIESIKKKSFASVGAGPYLYNCVKDDSVYLVRNTLYWLGKPNIKTIQICETDMEYMIEGIINDKYDICESYFSSDMAERIKMLNGGSLNGDAIYSQTFDHTGYTYIGINAENVKVGENKDSYESKSLRKAFAVLFSFYREEACNEYYGNTAKIINYPISDISWMAPKASDSEYKVAFSKDINGNNIYSPEMTSEERAFAALHASIEYFIAAGYIYDSHLDSFVMAPNGAYLEYDVTIPCGHPSLSLFNKAKLDLSTIGINLNIIEVSDINQLWDKLDRGDCQIWSAAWNTSAEHQLYPIYHSSNTDEIGGSGLNEFDIADEKLDTLILQMQSIENREILKSVYKECFDIILDWAVEIPFYQRTDVVLFNPYTINLETIIIDHNEYFNWIDNIHCLELN